jgi:hypothetical protein
MLSDLGNIACADQVILELTNSQRLEEALTRKQERDSSLPQISLWKLELTGWNKRSNSTNVWRGRREENARKKSKEQNNTPAGPANKQPKPVATAPASTTPEIGATCASCTCFASA